VNRVINSDTLTLAEATTFFIQTLASEDFLYSQETIKTYKFNFEQFIHFITQRDHAKTTLANITVGDVEEWLATMRRNDYSHSTIHNRVCSLKLAFALFHDYHYCSDIMSKITLTKRSKSRRTRANKTKTVALTKEEVKQLLDTVRSYTVRYSTTYLKLNKKKLDQTPSYSVNGEQWSAKKLRDYLFLTVLYCTGLRKKEILSLTKGQYNPTYHLFKAVVRKGGYIQDILILDLLEQYIYVNDTLPISLASLLELWLKDLPDTSKLFIISASNGNTITKTWSRRAKLPMQVKPHQMRHTFGTHLGNLGVNPITIKELMGHKQLATTENYIHADYRDMANNVSKLKLYSATIDADYKITKLEE